MLCTLSSQHHLLMEECNSIIEYKFSNYTCTAHLFISIEYFFYCTFCTIVPSLGRKDQLNKVHTTYVNLELSS